MRWDGKPGTLQVSVEDVRSVIDTLCETDGLTGSPARLLEKLERLDLTGTGAF